MKPRIHTENAMRDISQIVHHVNDDVARWYKVNWVIVSTSHTIYNRKGTRGHVVRQKIRRRLWNTAKKRHWVLRRYSLPREINGDSRCKVIWYYKVLDLFLFFKKIALENGIDS
jgi:hypothetical protein